MSCWGCGVTEGVTRGNILSCFIDCPNYYLPVLGILGLIIILTIWYKKLREAKDANLH